MKTNPFKAGQKVKYRDGDPRQFIVYAVYDATRVSLALADWPDVEQDSMTNIKEIEAVEKAPRGKDANDKYNF